MTKNASIDELELGTREVDLREPETLAQFLERAQALGFSDREIDRLRLTYSHAHLGRRDEHRLGCQSD